MLRECAVKYYRQGFNCAESILRAGNEVYDLKLQNKDMIMVAGFGGGLMIGDVCGALIGSIAVLSSKYVESKAHDCDFLRPLTQKMVIAFQKRMGSRVCAQIKPKLHTPELKCENSVAVAAEVLEEVILEWEESTAK
ncbi:MAG: C-GCAxxG-C-C family (seleno)protein [Longicatena sp.]